MNLPMISTIASFFPRGGGLPVILMDIATAVAVAKEAFEDGRWTDVQPAARARVLNRTAELLRERIPEMARIEAETRAVWVVFHAHAIARVAKEVERTPLDFDGRLVVLPSRAGG